MLLLVGACGTADVTADSDRPSEIEDAEAYESALAPLKQRSDVLEEEFATVQGEGTGVEDLREILGRIEPAYAELLDETRALDVQDRELRRAHDALLNSLDAQQEGLELALRALEEDDAALMADANAALGQAQSFRDEHRRLLAEAKS